MAKPSDPAFPDTGDEPITPGPDITVEPLTPPPDPAMLQETPPPEVSVRGGPGAERNGGGAGELARRLTPTPVPASWAAQPLHPMMDESTVPLPVEEVEFADTDDDLLVGRGTASVVTGPRSGPSMASPRRSTPASCSSASAGWPSIG